MSKASIIFWTGTGNTEAMAEALAEGARAAGAEVELLNVADAPSSVADIEYLMLGCPAMGSEELEDGEFAPWFESIENELGGKKLLLFGSYSWAEGEWMQTWKDRCADDGANVFDGVIQFEGPDDAAVENLKKIAGDFVKA